MVCRPPGCRLRLDVGSNKAGQRRPTCPEWCRFDGAYTAAAGHLFIFPRIAQNYVFIFYVSLDEKNVHFVRDSCKIFLQAKLPFGSCNVVLRARAVRSPLLGR